MDNTFCLSVIKVVLNPGLVFIFFSIAAAVTAVAALFLHDLNIQLALFLAFSALFLMLARPMLRQLFGLDRLMKTPSNVDTLVGSSVLVLETVDRYTGRVKVIHTGEIWSAYLDIRGNTGTVTEIEPRQEGVVSSIDGAKLVIKPSQTLDHHTEEPQES